MPITPSAIHLLLPRQVAAVVIVCHQRRGALLRMVHASGPKGATELMGIRATVQCPMLGQLPGAVHQVLIMK